MSVPLPVHRPRAVNGAFAGALTGSALAALLLGVSDRDLGYLGLGAAVSALVSVVLAFPMRTGKAWARVALFVSALVGALCAPAVANSTGSALTFAVGGALVLAWAVVVCLLARSDVREYTVLQGMRS
ncbi:hypothetical protein [Alloactinosynnema sp. L-07]|uniref:hypothetical protein n=1 Tax=Alloactinosynnema sp. L-07 TaxID=1653480 RepID=UPI00065EF816|nr:hypothetical protein [Alloactinosynnema sp. L-07]CRK60193.1 hypothetical protein [Alloactinosynnema sp. L-07]